VNRIAVLAEHALLAEVLSEALRKERELEVTAVADEPETMATEPIQRALTAVDVVLHAPTGTAGTVPWGGGPPLVLVDFLGLVGLEQALHLGARGYVGPREAFSTLVERLRSVAAGTPAFPPGALTELQAAARRLASEARGVRLTENEEQLVRWVAQGLAAKQIARLLGIGETAARGRIGRVSEKVGVSNMRELAAWAGEHGLYSHGVGEGKADEEE
jgi:DNA-binding NarL/FixJ family response regulator